MRLRDRIDAHCPAFLRPWWERLDASPIGRRLAGGAFWSMLGTVALKGSTLVALIVVARIIGKAEYGKLGVIQSTIAMVQVFATTGLGLTATKFVAETKEVNKGKLGDILSFLFLTSFLLNLIFTAAIVIFSGTISTHLYETVQMQDEFVAAAFAVFFLSTNMTLIGILNGFEEFKALAKINILASLAVFPLFIVLSMKWGLLGVVCAIGGQALLVTALSLLRIAQIVRKEDLRLSLGGARREWSVLISFSLPAVLAGLFYSPANWICVTLLARTETGYDEMGVFNAASQWFITLLFLPSIIGNVSMPLMAKYWKNEPSRVQETIRYNIKMNMLMSVTPCMLMLCCSPLLAMAYGSEFAPHWLVFACSIASVVPLALFYPYHRLLIMTGKIWVVVLIDFAYAVVSILFSLVLLPWGALGLAGAKLGANLVQVALDYLLGGYFLKKQIKSVELDAPSA